MAAARALLGAPATSEAWGSGVGHLTDLGHVDAERLPPPAVVDDHLADAGAAEGAEPEHVLLVGASGAHGLEVAQAAGPAALEQEGSNIVSTRPRRYVGWGVRHMA
jgi:hypothetical protein